MKTPPAINVDEMYIVSSTIPGDFILWGYHGTEKDAYHTAIHHADTFNMPVSICCRAKGMRDTIRPASAHPPTQRSYETQLEAFARMQKVENARAAAAGRMPRAMND